jgi:transcriptional regulator with XRE-family HTH domain
MSIMADAVCCVKRSRSEGRLVIERLPPDMDFSQRLAATRKARGLTQDALADAAGINVSQVRRYEGGTSQPSLEVLRKLAVALSVSADELLFDSAERGPDQALRLQFEAASRLPPHDKDLVREVVESIIIRHDANRWIRNQEAG